MKERSEQQQILEKPKKQYSELDAPQKARAMIAALRVPFGRENILHFAGADTSQLKDSEREAIEQVFNSTRVEAGPEEPPKYWVTTEHKQAVLQELSVDTESIKNQLADVMMKDFFGWVKNSRFSK